VNLELVNPSSYDILMDRLITRDSANFMPDIVSSLFNGQFPLADDNLYVKTKCLFKKLDVRHILGGR